MRCGLGILESLLAVGFLATAAVHLVKGNFGTTNLAGDLFLIAFGAWFAKLAFANCRPKPKPGTTQQ
jgi:hypothetical protein